MDSNSIRVQFYAKEDVAAADLEKSIAITHYKKKKSGDLVGRYEKWQKQLTGFYHFV